MIYTSFVVGKDFELGWHMFQPPGVNLFELSTYNLDCFFFQCKAYVLSCVTWYSSFTVLQPMLIKLMESSVGSRTWKQKMNSRDMD